MAAAGVSPARAAAFALLLRAARSSRHLELSSAASPELRGLEARDAGLALELVSGTLKRRNTLDAVVQRFSRPQLRNVAPPVLIALRLGAYQLLCLDRVPPHAAVGESVALVEERGSATRGFVNAVLRSVARDGQDALEELTAGDDTRSVALRLSHPEWLVTLFVAELGAEPAVRLMEADNRPPERCLRVNALHPDAAAAEERLAAEGVAAEPALGLRTALIVREGHSVELTAAFRDGLVTPQSRGSQLAGETVVAAAPAGARLADLCAAPGLKTAQLATVPHAAVLAVEEDAERAERLNQLARRLRLPPIEIRVQDATRLPADLDAAFDGVLLDAPCSGLGTLAARPDLRWRRRAADVRRLAALQRELLARAAALVRPGGFLVYSVCTVTRMESVAVVDELLAQGGWRLDDLTSQFPWAAHPERGGTLLTLPPEQGSSGFFVARLRRAERVGRRPPTREVQDGDRARQRGVDATTPTREVQGGST